MSISELGSLGEFIASLAVFVTLVLLILQFRSARKEISIQVTREIKRHNNDTFHQLTQNPELMHVHIRGQRDLGALTEQEKVTWSLWMFTWITQTEDGYLASRGGLPDMTWVDRYVTGIAAVIRSPGGAAVWPKLRGFFDDEFVRAVENKVEEEPTTWLEMLLD